MERIKDWVKNKSKCTCCNTYASVKYQHEGKPYCNRCIARKIKEGLKQSK